MKKIYLLPIGLTFLFLLSNHSLFSQGVDIELKASANNLGFLVEWEITDDISADQVLLERSVHGTRYNTVETYEDLQEILEEKTSFSFLDNQMGIEKVAYRLKFIEEDQSVFFSKPFEISKKIMNTYRVAEQQLLPQGVLKVTVESIGESNLEFILIDENGEKVFKDEWSADLGLNDFFINLDDFKDGTYSALLKHGKEYQTINFDKTTRKSDEVALKNSKWNNKQ